MNAVSRSVPVQRRPSRQVPVHSRVRSSRSSHLSPLKPRTSQQKVERLNTSRERTPGWLRSLMILQRGSDVITVLLGIATLTIYSWTVYTQQQWTQEYRKLGTLQRNERDLTTTNEIIKDQLAQQAERPATGLVTPTTANTILLPPAPQRQFRESPNQKPEPETLAKTPLGY
ncbi:MAG: hypothetical protein RID09_22510 [Coleofasciculus sp. G1-WW12-02]|uniref:hypothetical protein n=1 Tax=Coleofasciculus sp. G1-WW12-02 TaxID=3068483 RepID=UPI003304BD93